MINREETLKQTIVLAIYFMLTYTTYLSFSCIITYIAEHDDGQYDYAPLVALVVNYSVYFVTLIFSSAITDYKKQFQISAICHLINYAVYIPGFTDDWGLIAGIVGALFGGYGAAIYWVSQGGYLIKLFRTYHIPENQEGKYFGIANGIVYGSSLFGALITTFGLGLFGTQIYFIILTVLSLVSWAVCAFFLDGLQTNRKQQSLVTQNPTSIASIAQHLVGVDPVQVQTRWQLIKMIFWNTLLYYPKMYYLWLPIIFDGFISGFISTYLNKILPESLRTDLNVGFMLMLQGFGCILGAVTSATLSDRFSVLNIGKVGMMIILLSCALTYLNELLNFEGLEFPFFVAFVWGFLINYITSLESVSCAKINNGYLYSFSIVKQIQALAFIAFQIYLILGNNTIDLIGFLIVLSALSLLAVGILFQFEARRKRVRVEIE